MKNHSNEKKNKKEQKLIFLNTKRPTINILSSEAKQYHYLIGSKVCYGNFVVYSSQDEVKPIDGAEFYEDELSIKDIKSTINLDNVYFPIYLKDKIGNSRKNGADYVINTLEDIVDNYGDYLNLFKEKELYSIISVFFSLVYDEIVKLNKDNGYKIDFLSVDQVKPIFDNIINCETLNSCYYLSNEFLNIIKDNNVINNIFHNLLNSIGLLYTIDFNIKDIAKTILEVQNIRNYIYSMFYTLGLPYIMNSELGDTIHLKNDFIANCYDSFIKIGLLIEMFKRLNYPTIKDTYKEVLSLTNLPNISSANLQNILKDCIISEYEFISKVTSIDIKEVTIKFKSDTKKATSTNNIIDFYYHYFINHFEDGTLDELIKDEEIKNIRKMFEEKYSKIKDEDRRNKMLKRINEDGSYLRQLYKQQLEYKEKKESIKQ